METFYHTIAIVFGILLPIIIVFALAAAVIIARSIPEMLRIKAEEIKKQPPFDEVEVNFSPATNAMIARFIKKGDIVWQGSSSRREMEENDRLVFNTEKPE